MSLRTRGPRSHEVVVCSPDTLLNIPWAKHPWAKHLWLGKPRLPVDEIELTRLNFLGDCERLAGSSRCRQYPLWIEKALMFSCLLHKVWCSRSTSTHSHRRAAYAHGHKQTNTHTHTYIHFHFHAFRGVRSLIRACMGLGSVRSSWTQPTRRRNLPSHTMTGHEL